MCSFDLLLDLCGDRRRGQQLLSTSSLLLPLLALGLAMPLGFAGSPRASMDAAGVLDSQGEGAHSRDPWLCVERIWPECPRLGTVMNDVMPAPEVSWEATVTGS